MMGLALSVYEYEYSVLYGPQSHSHLLFTGGGLFRGENQVKLPCVWFGNRDSRSESTHRK